MKVFDALPACRPNTPLLDVVNHPQDIKRLNVEELLQLCDELRGFLLYSAPLSGGHFAANLGVVELTVALHYVLNTPEDRLVWDVGHQAYPHKILTGRKHLIHRIRHLNGLAAFPDRKESEFDTFGVGHSSTSVSAALGMAVAARYQQSPKKIVCVIGDGAFTAGMVYEAINDLVQQQADVLIVLNDNEMSISKNTGGLSKHLASLVQTLQNTQQTHHLTLDSRLEITKEDHARDMAEHNVFKALGLHYFGPVDGHSVDALVTALNGVWHVRGPKLLHVYTQKGKGFSPAELDPIGFHAISKQQSGAVAQSMVSTKASPHLETKPTLVRFVEQWKTHKPQKYSDVFGQFLCDLAAQDERMLAITPAMCEGSGMVDFSQQYPQRFFDVAIAEQHAVTLAAGMACEGIKPIVAIYSTFLQRGYDQLVHDVALQNLDVTFAIDRAGIVGEDGATHAGTFDYAFMRTVPNMVIMAPKDEAECRNMLFTAYQYEGPAAVRYPRGVGVGACLLPAFEALPIGKAEVLVDVNVGCLRKIALLAFGSMVATAVDVAHHLSACAVHWRVVNMRFVKPLDVDMLMALHQEGFEFVTLEEHALMGGAGSAVSETLAARNIHLPSPVLHIALPDQFVGHGSPQEILHANGLSVEAIVRRIQTRFGLQVSKRLSSFA